MSLVHRGVDCVAVAVLEAEELALDAEEAVDGTEALGNAVLGVLDVLCAPDPEVALLHPASAAPATNAVRCALLRIIGLSLLGIQSTSLASSCRRLGVTREIQPFDTFMNISGRAQRSRSLLLGATTPALGTRIRRLAR